MANISIHEEKCIGCGSCVRDCVSGFLYIKDGKAAVKEKGCIGCGHCYAICPTEAVSMTDPVPDGGEYVPMTVFDSKQLLQAMKSRRTVRRFRPDPVEQEKLDRILEAGRYCPTGGNGQGVAFTILGSRQAEAEAICVNLFRKGTGIAGKLTDFFASFTIDDHYFFKGAPLVIVVSAKSAGSANLASSYMELMAESDGLGVLYSGFFIACTSMSAKLRRLLDLPKGHKAVTCMVIGYPDVKYRRIPGRKPLNVKKL